MREGEGTQARGQGGQLGGEPCGAEETKSSSIDGIKTKLVRNKDGVFRPWSTGDDRRRRREFNSAPVNHR